MTARQTANKSKTATAKKAATKTAAGKSANEGEGNKTAARRFNAAQQRFVEAGKVEPAARAARKAVDGAEGKALREAERASRRPARGKPIKAKR